MDICKILDEKYNITVQRMNELARDVNYSSKNYHVAGEDGRDYIVKTYSDQEEISFALEEQRLLEFLEGKLTFRTPQVIYNQSKDTITYIGYNALRVQTFVEGEFLSDMKASRELISELGENFALLSKRLLEFKSNLLISRRLFWDIQNASHSYDKVNYIKDSSLRKYVEYYFDRFHNLVLPQFHKLRRSIIHGDLNTDNILIKDGHLNGIIDFGDASESYLINELAVASTYMMLGSDRPFEDLLAFVSAFNSKFALEEEELRVLPDLICIRLCISICNSSEKQAKGLANDYTLVNENAASELLKRWPGVNPEQLIDDLLDACSITQDKQVSTIKQSVKRRESFTSKALSLSYKSPIHMTGALFQYMYDAQGNTYLDAYNNIPHVGHSHPKVSRAISNQQRKLNTNTRYLYNSLADYSEKLLAKFPPNLNRVFYVNSGSAASDLAIRLAKNYTQLNNLLVMEHGYHGNTSTGISISPYKFDGKGGTGTPEGICKLSLPNLYNGKYPTTESYVDEAISSINQLIETGNTPAAFIAEPISGCGGQVAIAPGYLKDLYNHCETLPTLMISDEVQVGFGRLGNWFWGFEMHEVIPDIVILGKPMANGHPMGAVVTTSEIADAFDNGMEFFSSFGGNPVSCEAALAVLNVMENEGLQENALTVGSYYLEAAKSLQNIYPCIGDVRGEGLFIGIEITNPDGTPATELAGRVKNELRNNLILASTDGPYDNVIKSKPPLCFTKANVDTFIEALKIILERNR